MIAQDQEEHGAQAGEVQHVLQQVHQLAQLWQHWLDDQVLGGELQPPASYQGNPPVSVSYGADIGLQEYWDQENIFHHCQSVGSTDNMCCPFTLRRPQGP